LAFDPIEEESVLFGGNAGNLQRSDTWAWDGTDWVAEDPPLPEARFSSAATYDAERGEMVLFGGGVDQGMVGDTWTWDGAWTEEQPTTSPSPRTDSVIVFDDARDEVVLFGGFGTGGSELGDTWIWDGTGWSQRDTLLAPVPRLNAVMAYDAARGEVVLWGGYNGDLGVVLDDTWTWNGTEWSLERPAHSPVGRSGASMSFDPELGQMVLFGGYDANVTYTSDTWTWDGTDWTRQDPATVPHARSASSMTYDPALGGVVLFGGNSGLGEHLADTWLWDGADWTDVGADDGPGGRWDAAFVYDTKNGEAILFGGNDNNFLDETWRWSLGDGPPRPPKPKTTVFTGTGSISLGNPGVALAGITQTTFTTACSASPPAQGVDGYVFDLGTPVGAQHELSAVASAAGPTDAYDLDLAFFDAECALLDMLATDAPKERAEVPRNTRYVVVNAAAGRDLSATLELTRELVP
jgi:hypothetical protein